MKPGYTIFNNALFEENLTHIEFRVLLYILKWSNTSKPLAFKYIALNTNMSSSSVQKAIKSLTSRGLISTAGKAIRGKSTTYIPHKKLTVKAGGLYE